MNTRELEVLNIIFASGKPMTSSDIVRCNLELTQSTVIAVLRKLSALEMVSVDGVTHSGKVLSRQYVPGPKAREKIENYYLKEFEKTKDILSANDLLELIKRFKGMDNQEVENG